MSITVTTVASGAQMTYLQLVQRLKQECGVTGPDLLSVQGQLVADIARLTNWINAAWIDIQNARRDWFFMRQNVQFNATPDGGRLYTPAQVGIPHLASYKLDSFRCYSAALGVSNQQILPWEPYDQFRNLYLFGANSLVSARPILFSVDPHKNVVLGPIPNETYVISGEAYLQPAPLVNDNDIPTLPDQFHMLIVYKAMMYFGGFDAAPDVYDRGEIEFKRMMLQLQMDQAPQITFGGPLA